MKNDGTNKGFWERFAKIYTAFMTKNDAAYDVICEKLWPYIDGEKRVLELACGTGQITFRMAAGAALWEATDYSENMIGEAAKRNTGKNRCEKIRFHVQDATALTYENDIFDVVVIANALHIMPSPDLALREIYRVLKKGGILFAPTFVYEKGYAKPLIFVMEKLGFKTYHKWTKDDLIEYVGSRGFAVMESSLAAGRPLPECILAAQKRPV